MTKKKKAIIDLSLGIYHEMPVHNDDPRIGFINFTNISSSGCNMTQLLLSTHGGTHMDAPSHFIESGIGIDRIDLNKCIGNSIVIDISGLANKREINISDLKQYEYAIKTGSRILLRTDWYKKFPSKKYYNEFYGVSIELAKWLVEKKIYLIGVETPAIHSVEYEIVHKTFFKGGVVIVESLANLDLIKSDNVYFCALPLKLKDLDGSPIRAIAVTD